ncbi:unnamed protein product, partial [Ectocarpus sp. 8 AP-2014]
QLATKAATRVQAPRHLLVWKPRTVVLLLQSRPGSQTCRNRTCRNRTCRNRTRRTHHRTPKISERSTSHHTMAVLFQSPETPITRGKAELR